MTARPSLVDELEVAIASSDIGRRAVILRRVADLFVSTAGNLSIEQTALFDGVMHQLLDEIETGARAKFAEYLAGRPAAPSGMLRELALDDAIAVACPILSHAEQLDEMTLVEGARHKSQAHLLAISTRKLIPTSVTDILLERGDREVALSTAGNRGAALSEFGYSSLVRRSSGDDELAFRTWSRPEIPRRHLLKLFADASETVRRRLSREDPRKAALITETVTRAASQLQTRTREGSADFTGASALVQSLRQAGKLDETVLFDFADSEKFDETVLALAVMCDLPVGLVERALVDERSEQILVLAKAIGLTWKTTKAILLLQARTEKSTAELDGLLETFLRLKPETANKVRVDDAGLRDGSLNVGIGDAPGADFGARKSAHLNLGQCLDREMKCVFEDGDGRKQISRQQEFQDLPASVGKLEVAKRPARTKYEYILRGTIADGDLRARSGRKEVLRAWFACCFRVFGSRSEQRSAKAAFAVDTGYAN